MITAIEIENFKAIGGRKVDDANATHSAEKGARIELKPLTLIFGPNSAGKSTIIQALHCAQEIFERHNLDPDRTVSGGEAFDLGGFRNIVHRHDLGRALRLRFELDRSWRELPDYHDESFGAFEDMDGASEIETMLARGRSAWVEAEIRWNESARLATVARYGAGLDGKVIAALVADEELIAPGDDNSAFALVGINFKHPLLNTSRDQEALGKVWRFSSFGKRAKRLFSASTKDPGFAIAKARFETRGRVPSAMPQWGQVLNLDSPAGDSDGQSSESWERDWVTRVELTKMIVGPGEALRDELRVLRYLGPIRAMPPRNYFPPSLPDKQRWATGLGAWDRLHDADQEFIARVNGWLSRLKCGYAVRLKDYCEVDQRSIPDGEASQANWLKFREDVEKQPLKRRVVLAPDGQSIEVLPNDVGIGISQLLPAVVLALDAIGGIVAIEQPEIHLHPALQAELGDLFIEAALGQPLENRRPGAKTLIIETHSEHLILRLLRRIRETTEGTLPANTRSLRPDQVSVIYVEQTEQGVQLSHLRIDETGEFIDRWPKGFFEEREDELF